MAESLPPFTQIGPYTVLGKLGEGGMGEVYLARSPGGRKVAVKTIRRELLDDPRFRARFRTEAAAARRVSGAFTAPVIDADADSAIPWLATAYVPAPTLSALVAEQGPLSAPELHRLAAGVAEALGSVHAAGVLHRDLKPSNIMMASDGPRLIDFGIARAVDPEARSAYRPGRRPIGTPGYIAPERLAGRDATEAADVFSLGAVLCFAATGTGPYGAGPAELIDTRVAGLEPDLSGIEDALTAMVAKYCLAREPGARPGVSDILGILDGRPFTPPRITEADRGPQDRSGHGSRRFLPTRRRTLIYGSAGTAAVAVAVTLAFVLPGGRSGGPGGGSGFAWTLPQGASGTLLGLWSGNADVVVGTQTGGLKGYNAATGAVSWTWTPPSGDAVCSMSDDTSAGIGAVTYGPSTLDAVVTTCSELQTIAVNTGRAVWSAPISLSVTASAAPSQSGVRSLSIDNGLVTAPYFATADQSAGQGTDTDLLVASASGKTEWTTDFGTGPLPDGCALTGTAQLLGSSVYALGECAGGSRTDLFSLSGGASTDARDLGALGQCEGTSGAAGTGFLSADADYLLIDCPGGASSSGLYALSQSSTKAVRIDSVAPAPAASGTIAGDFAAPGGVLLSGSTLYLADAQSGTNSTAAATAITAVNLADGTLLWTQTLQSASAVVPLTASPTGVEVLSDDGGTTASHLIDLDASTGKTMSTHSLGSTPTASFDSFTSGTDLPYAVPAGSNIAIAFPEAMMSNGLLLAALSTT